MSDLDRPNPTIFTPAAGTHADFNGQHVVILKPVSLDSVLVELAESEERQLAPISSLSPWRGHGDKPEQRKTPDLAALSEEERVEGLRRLSVLKQLLAMKYRTRKDVEIIGEELGLRVSHIYALMARLQREGTWTCLIPHAEKGRPRKKALLSLVEQIVQEAIDKVYMDRHNAPAAEVIRETERVCMQSGIKAPAPNTIRARIRERDTRTVVAARRGKKEARDRFDPVLGPWDEARWPLQKIQVDHTVVDFFVVSEETGEVIGRPILTVVIDEFSRAVLGFHLSLRPPSTLSVALALTHAVLPKDAFLKAHGVQSRWDCFGLPKQMLTDSGAEFDSRGVIAGCAQYGIDGVFRPLGRPHFGGRVERLIGSLMGRVKLMPGATMRSIEERGDGYDPQKGAALTLQEAETRMALEICDIYHRSTHSAIGTTPLKLWEFGILGDDTTPGRGTPNLPADRQRFLMDFLPLERRTVQDYGIQIDYIRYHSPILRAFTSGSKNGRQFIVRYDPRDMSHVYLYDDQNAAYIEVPRANAHFEPTALWEVKAAIKKLKSEGRDPDDELAIQRAVEQARLIDAEAIARSRKARRNMELRKEDERGRRAAPVPQTQVAAGNRSPENQPEEPPSTHINRRRARPLDGMEEW